MARITPASRKISAVLAHSDESPGDSQNAPRACNFIQLLANSEAVSGAYRAWENGLVSGHLNARQRQLIALAVAEMNGSKYCLSAHFASGRKAGLSEDEMRLARRGTAKDPHTRALLQFVQEVTLQRGDVSDRDFEALRSAGYTDGQIIEVVANVAFNIFTNYVNLVARTEVDFPVLKPGEEMPLASS